MIVTTYTCDLCSHKQGTPLDMIEVGVTVRALDRSGTGVTQERQIWCRPCCIKRGLVFKTDLDDAVRDDPAPTIEDLVREIVHEETDL